MTDLNIRKNPTQKIKCENIQLPYTFLLKKKNYFPSLAISQFKGLFNSKITREDYRQEGGMKSQDKWAKQGNRGSQPREILVFYNSGLNLKNSKCIGSFSKHLVLRDLSIVCLKKNCSELNFCVRSFLDNLKKHEKYVNCDCFVEEL